MREMLSTHKDILVKLEKIEKKLLQHDVQMNKQEENIQMVFTALKKLFQSNQQPRPRIGFRRKDEKDQ